MLPRTVSPPQHGKMQGIFLYAKATSRRDGANKESSAHRAAVRFTHITHTNSLFSGKKKLWDSGGDILSVYSEIT